VKKRGNRNERMKIRRIHDKMVRWDLMMGHYPLWLTLEQQAELTDRLLAYGVVAPLDAPASDPRIQALDMLPDMDHVISEDQVAVSLGAAEGTPAFSGAVAGKNLEEIEEFLVLAKLHYGLSMTFVQPASSMGTSVS
jgi:hypothetical protein